MNPRYPAQQYQDQNSVDGNKNFPICKNVMAENWDDDNLQDQSQQANKNTQIKDTPQMNLVQNEKQTLAQNVQYPQNHQGTQNPQPTWTLLNPLDKYMEQVCHQKEEWKRKMERLNEKYRLDSFCNLELDSEFDEGEDLRYEHNYETLI